MASRTTESEATIEVVGFGSFFWIEMEDDDEVAIGNAGVVLPLSCFVGVDFILSVLALDNDPVNTAGPVIGGELERDMASD